MLKLSLLNIFRHKVRTILSVVGIMLGVASLIALVSVVDGVRAEISDALSKAQGGRITPIGATDPVFNFMDDKWVDKIARVQGVRVAVPVVIQPAKSVDGAEQSFFGATRLIGLDVGSGAKAVGFGFSGEILEGRDFRVPDKKVVIAGKKVKSDYGKFLGSKIKLNGEHFTIIGFFTTGSSLLDNSVLMPLDDLRRITDFPYGKISFVSLQFSNPSEDRRVVDRINLIYGEEILARSLNDFSSQFGDVFNAVTLLVGLIASIASIVAGVGIINTMLMSVLERFREIGALKAVGWTSGEIMKMVLYESLFVGAIGGFLGLALGLAATGALGLLGLRVVVSIHILALSFFGAVLIGALGGLYPAFIASRMNPVDALRSE